MRVDFGEWRPDLPDTDMGASQVAKNVLPSLGGYIPFKKITAYSQALDARCRGAISVREHANTAHVYSGDAAKLYELVVDGTWTDLSKAGGYSTSETENWNFAQFGEQVIAVNYDDATQVYTMGVSALFADLAGSPPRARFVKTLRDFVVLSATSDDPTEVRWSAINDATGWTSGTNQSGAQSFPDSGHCHGVFGSEVGYVFFEKAIYQMSYAGPPLLWKFNKISSERGALHHRTIVEVGDTIYFAAEDGFYALQGGKVSSIGHEKVDEFFLSDIQRVFAYRGSVAADPVNKIVMWAYSSTDEVAGDVDTIIAYSWATGRWSYVKYDMEYISPAISLGYTLDTLDNITTDIDTYAIPFDSPVLSGGYLQFAGFTQAHEMGLFTGGARAATLETKEMTLSEGARTFVSAARTVVDASDLTIRLGSRDRTADAVSYSASVAQETHGLIPLRQSGRYHRVEVAIPEDSSWEHAQAIELFATEVGGR